MAKPHPGTVADVLFTDFLAPLLLGGPMRPGKPIGGKTALAMEGDRPFADPELGSLVQLARVRVARRFVPIDRYEALTSAEWALCAALHDIVQSTHPGFDGVFRRNGPNRLLTIIDRTLDLVARPATVGESLSRHTLFSRMFEITRTDISLEWWVGKETFLGTDPPSRLKAWPELRRVHETRLPHDLMALPTSGGVVASGPFSATVSKFLERTPLTDLATADRREPSFAWTGATLGLIATRAGRTLASRSLSLRPDGAIDEALGRATKPLLEGRRWEALGRALELLGERMLSRAVLMLGKPEETGAIPQDRDATPSGFARSAGAFAAQRLIATTGAGLGDMERRRVLGMLAPAADSGAGKVLASTLGG